MPKLIRILFVFAAVVLTVSRAWAGPVDELPDLLDGALDACPGDPPSVGTYYDCIGPPGGGDGAQASQGLSIARSSTFRMNNFNATLEPGEPTFGGRMKKTIWAKLKFKANARVVISTFGTPFDAALAVYRGNKIGALTLVTANDDFPVAGIYGTPSFSLKQSLVQFNATAGVDYRIQFGSKSGAERSGP